MWDMPMEGQSSVTPVPLPEREVGVGIYGDIFINLNLPFIITSLREAWGCSCHVTSENIKI